MPKTSFTAPAIASGFVAAANEPQWNHLVDPDVAKLTDFFIEQHIYELPYGIGYAFIKFVRKLPYHLQKKIYSKIVTPGASEHFAVRKLLINQQVEEAIISGNNQIVIMGAGCDAQSLVWHKKYPHVDIFEVDYGNTQTIKVAALEKIKHKERAAIDKLGFGLVNKYAELGRKLHFVMCDLSREDAIATLCQNGLDLTKNTIVIAEGFTMFLTMEELDVFFGKVHKMIGTGGRFVFSFSQPKKKGRIVADALQKESQEKFKSSALPEQVPEIMHRNSFNMYGKALFVDMQRQIGNKEIVSRHVEQPWLPKEDYYVVQRASEEQKLQPVENVPEIKLAIPALA